MCTTLPTCMFCANYVNCTMLDEEKVDDFSKFNKLTFFNSKQRSAEE